MPFCENIPIENSVIIHKRLNNIAKNILKIILKIARIFIKIIISYFLFPFFLKWINMYKPKDFAELIGVSVKTLQRWDNDGILVAKRNPKNRRYYTQEQLMEYLNISKTTNKIVIYSRVSTSNQKQDLENQVEFFHSSDPVSLLLCRLLL